MTALAVGVGDMSGLADADRNAVWASDKLLACGTDPLLAGTRLRAEADEGNEEDDEQVPAPHRRPRVARLQAVHIVQPRRWQSASQTWM